MKKSQWMEEKIKQAPSFDVDPKKGLSSEQVKQRTEQGYVNKVEKHPTKTYTQIILDNVFNYINIVLFFVFIIILIAGLPFKYCFFMLIVGANTLIGLYQDIHARRLIDRLKVVSNPKAIVVRDGKEMEIPSVEIVLSDVVVFQSGDQVLADAVVLDGTCSVDESLLTGESATVSKKKGDRLLSGTYLTKGRVLTKIEKIGAANYAETLQSEASIFQQPKSEIRRSVTAFIMFTGTIALILGLAMYLVYGFQSGDWGGFFKNQEMVRFVTSSMVAMLPTGMFLLTSTSLAVGVIALAKKRMLVQQLYCIEMLARVDVLCLDKTGTLTNGSMEVVDVVAMGGHSKKEVEEAIRSILHHTKDTNATANVLRHTYGDDCQEQEKETIPFDSAVKYSAVTLSNGKTYAFGAFGFIPVQETEGLEELVKKHASKGERVIVVAASSLPIENDRAPKGMDVLGVLFLSDHVKEDAKENIAWFQNNEVTVRVISGDDPVTVSEIARRVGVNHSEKYVSLEGKSLDEVKALANEYAVFGRVSPEQKACLVNAFKEQGHKVAMTGDGVNDILALKVADCSIAMASGSDAAKSVAHLVSLDNDFSKLPDVVCQGRRVINNLQRTCSLFLNKTFFALILTTLFLILQAIIGTKAKYPFTSPNLFLWEFFTIGLSAFFLALQPSNDRLKGEFLRNIIVRSVPAGIAECIAALLPLLLWLVWPESFTHLASAQDSYRLAVSMAVISFTIISDVVLFRVCLPFTKYRAVVYISATVLTTASFVLDAFGLLNWGFLDMSLDINYSGMTWGFILCTMVITLIAGGIYFLFDYIAKKWVYNPKKEQK